MTPASPALYLSLTYPWPHPWTLPQSRVTARPVLP